MVSEVELVGRLLLATGLGAIVGLERELSHKPAGLRTHMLVCLGSTLFTVVSIFDFQVDPARIAAGIVQGVGFIGAGSIIAARGQVHGVTTAASLWTVAAIGLAVGVGNYLLSLITTLIIFSVLQLDRLLRPEKTQSNLLKTNETSEI